MPKVVKRIILPVVALVFITPVAWYHFVTFPKQRTAEKELGVATTAYLEASRRYSDCVEATSKEDECKRSSGFIAAEQVLRQKHKDYLDLM